MAESSSMADVLGNRNRSAAAADQGPEETKAEVPQINPAELNDLSLGEFRIEAIRIKNAEVGELLWEGLEWDLNSDEA